ncbi:MAG: hypothetical protein AB7Q69_04640 [Gemmatimonadales bacterium]
MNRKLALPGGVAMLAALLLPMAHPTPVVELVKQALVIRRTLPDAQRFFVRTVSLGREDLARIRQEVDYDPENPDVKFYYGKDQAGRLDGVVLFPQYNTIHGPVEVGLTMSPDGRITSVIVTKATAETKPWVLHAVSTGFLSQFKGLAPGDSVAPALKGLSAGKLGAMPFFMAESIGAAVERGLVLYANLYKAE